MIKVFSKKVSDDLEHLLKLQGLKGGDSKLFLEELKKRGINFPVRYGDWYTIGDVCRIMDAGFSMFITRKFISKYNYAALFNIDLSQQVVGLVSKEEHSLEIYEGVYFSGDVPNYILDRVEIVKQIEIDGNYPWEFLVVSKYPLPVERRRLSPISKPDPVMIGLKAGANAHPLQIGTDEKGKIMKWENGRKAVNSWGFYDKVGFIIGGWGSEPEFD